MIYTVPRILLRHYKIFLAACITMICAQVSTAQDVLWASKILGYSSEFRPSQFGNEYRAVQILDEPDKLPDVGDSPCAWSPALAESSSEEWVKVGFSRPVKLKQVVIAENFNPGAIIRVYGYDTNGQEFLLEGGSALEARGEKGRLLHVFPAAGLEIIAQAIKIVMLPAKVPGFNQIDAIGITSQKDPVKVSVRVAADAPVGLMKENLGKNINSRAEEVAPVISPDGKTLYFTRSGHRGNTGSPATQDVWYSTLDRSGQWSEAQNIKAPINTIGDNAVTGISADGKTLYLLNTYLSNGSMGGGFSRSFMTSTGWSQPVACNIENYYKLDESNQIEFSVSPKGTVLVMAIHRRDTKGRKDLYRSFLKADGSWSEPVNMGDRINTADVEGSPFLAPDNKTLYFTSFGHRGYGNGDIFITRRLDDTWLNWSKPENLGPGINSGNWDGYFSIPASGEYAYMSSNSSLDGSDDLFRVRLYPSIKPEMVAVVSGAVLNADGGARLKATMLVDNAVTNEVVDTLQYDPATGDYKVLLPLKQNYRITALAEGFLSSTETLDLREERGSVTKKLDIRLVALQPGKKISLKQIFFAQSSPVIDSTSLPELKRIVLLMNKYPAMEIFLEGHTDNQGDFQKNLKLSEDRVNAVKAYLVQKNIAPDRVQVKAWGPSKPIGNNMTEESRKQNRRVEFTILKI